MVHETIQVHTGSLCHDIPLQDDTPLCIPSSIQQIIWTNPRQSTTEHIFFHRLHHLLQALKWNGTIQFVPTDTVNLFALFSFPSDCLGAVVSPTSQGFVQVDGVHNNGIAQRLGLQIGDVIRKWNGSQISEFNRPWKYLKTHGDAIQVQVERNAIIHELSCTTNPALHTEEILERIANLFGLQKHPTDRYTWTKIKPTLSNKPLVSVLMHAYKPHWFREALQSVLDQTYTNLEIIIGDDNTTGEIASIVQELAPHDSRIQYHLNTPPFRGWGAGNRYFCYEQSTGDLVKYLCDDDILYPTCIEKMVRALQEHPDVSLITSHRHTIDEIGVYKSPNLATRRIAYRDMKILGIRAMNVMHGFASNAIGEPSTTMFRKKDAEQYIYYLDTIAGIEAETGLDDISLWFALLCKGNLLYLAEAQSAIRVTPQQGTAQSNMANDYQGKWLRSKDLLYRFGGLHPDDVRLQGVPIETNTNPNSPQQIYMRLLDATPISTEEAHTIQTTIRAFHDWTVLPLLLHYRVQGFCFPQKALQGKKLAQMLLKDLYASISFPMMWGTHYPKNSYLFYMPNIPIPGNMLFELTGAYIAYLRYRYNHSAWSDFVPKEQFSIPIHPTEIDCLLEFQAISITGNIVSITHVELVGLVASAT